MCLRKLQRLKLGWCINLPAEEFAHLGTLTTLRELHLTRCGVNDECLGKLGGLADLRILSLAQPAATFCAIINFRNPEF